MSISALLFILLASIFSTPVFAETYTVEKVIDGNTLKLSNGETVRFIGMHAPESQPNEIAKIESQRTGVDIKIINKMGQEAKEFVKKLVEGKKVRLEFDYERKDPYGRLWAYVYELVCLGDCAIETKQGYEYYKLDDGWYIFVNATIVKSGYASPRIIPPNVKYINLFRELYVEAMKNKAGLWQNNKNNRSN